MRLELLCQSAITDVDWLQLAAVSKSFREAVKAVLSSHWYVDLATRIFPLPSRMDTALLLDWAPACTKMFLSNDACNVPGLQSFAAAASLRKLWISCNDSMLAAAKADAVLSVLGGLEKLQCSGWYNPSTFPSTLKELHISLSGWENATRRVSAPGEHVAALLYRLAPLQSLHTLHLVLGDCLELPNPEQPLKLTHLDISFNLRCDLHNEGSLDFSWLKAQPSEELSLSISIYTGDTDMHTLLVDVLEQLSIKCLWLSHHTAMSAAAQRQWARVEALDKCKVELCEPGMCLVATPECFIREIELDPRADLSVSIDWAALCNVDGMVSTNCHHGQQICILGQTNELPGSSEPWQLTVHHPDQVKGLPDVRGRWDDYHEELVYQNDAADEVDW